MKPKGLYIHIPFCDHICTYCDFPKLLTKGQQLEGYLNALIQELKYYEEKIGFEDLETLYFGGGTPTALSVSQLSLLFDYLKQVIDFDQLTEVSMEANPENLSQEKVVYLVKQGVTRISLGVQTFNEKFLKQIGRKHTSYQVKEAIECLKENGMTNINLDLIYSIPGQSLDQVKSDLEIAISLDVEHISAYSLIVEEHTQLYIDYMKDRLELTDNDIEAEMYKLVISTLIEQGFEHYEISNFSKGSPSLHNKWYWLNAEYIGVGLGAHGYVLGSRYSNTRSINSYIQCFEKGDLPVIECHVLSTEEKIEEEMFLGLRLTKGINIEAVNKKFEVQIEALYEPVLKKLTNLRYLELEEGWLRLTKQGLMMANEVFEGFLLN